MPRGGPRENSGGAREGAGRPAGSGWKPATSAWRQTAAEHAAELVGSDRDPLLFLIDRTFDETLDIQTRVGCATTAVKYLHPTLSASSVSASHTVTRIDAGELLTRVAERIAKQALTTIEHESIDVVKHATEAPEQAAVLPP
jgi:hypothetical protein